MYSGIYEAMRIDRFTFGSIRIDGVVYEHDVVIAAGQVRKRKKKASRPFRGLHRPHRAPELGLTRLLESTQFRW
jgi:hypothetical protein